MEHGAWSMEHEAWSMEHGAWSMERTCARVSANQSAAIVKEWQAAWERYCQWGLVCMLSAGISAWVIASD